MAAPIVGEKSISFSGAAMKPLPRLARLTTGRDGVVVNDQRTQGLGSTTAGGDGGPHRFCILLRSALDMASFKYAGYRRPGARTIDPTVPPSRFPPIRIGRSGAQRVGGRPPATGTHATDRPCLRIGECWSISQRRLGRPKPVTCQYYDRSGLIAGLDKPRRT